MKSSDDTDPLSQRMDAMSRLTRGRVSDALSSLVAARKNAEGQSGGARCQASLALAVGLSFAGRHHESLLEALDALARARQAEDEKAIRACIVFLSTLYKKVGRPQEASLIACARS